MRAWCGGKEGEWSASSSRDKEKEKVSSTTSFPSRLLLPPSISPSEMPHGDPYESAAGRVSVCPKADARPENLELSHSFELALSSLPSMLRPALLPDLPARTHLRVSSVDIRVPLGGSVRHVSFSRLLSWMRKLEEREKVVG